MNEADLVLMQGAATIFVNMKPHQRRRIDGAVCANHMITLMAEVRRQREQVNQLRQKLDALAAKWRAESDGYLAMAGGEWLANMASGNVYKRAADELEKVLRATPE